MAPAIQAGGGIRDGACAVDDNGQAVLTEWAPDDLICCAAHNVNAAWHAVRCVGAQRGDAHLPR